MSVGLWDKWTRYFTNLQALQLPSCRRILPSVQPFKTFLSIINYFYSFNVNILWVLDFVPGTSGFLAGPSEAAPAEQLHTFIDLSTFPFKILLVRTWSYKCQVEMVYCIRAMCSCTCRTASCPFRYKSHASCRKLDVLIFMNDCKMLTMSKRQTYKCVQ